MPSTDPVIHWFRQDLRLADNPALAAAGASGRPVIAAYILDDDNAGDCALGGASRWWLHQSLRALRDSLDGRLWLGKGPADELLPALVRESGARAVYWNRCYEPWRIDRDRRLKSDLQRAGIEVHSFNGSLLFEPMHVSRKDGGPYKVFTPFYRKGCLQNGPSVRGLVANPDSPDIREPPDGATLDELELMPAIHWYDTIEAEWQPGERGAAERLDRFLESGIDNYKDGRNRPDLEHVSRLSPHLHFGEISPQQVWHAAKPLARRKTLENDVDHFLSELGWREFSYNLLYHWPEIVHANLQPKFDGFPWREDDEALARWQQGQTGVPIVDAGMRELWQTGYMHNRVRMVTASFLVKNLMLHWRQGEAWFWDTLLDADLANNSASWQWVAGSGADAAPYFRIFNPVLQGKRFDPDGVYVRRYVPEIAELPDRYLHAPWEAPADVLDAAGIVLGETYPRPLVDLGESRERALDAFKALPGNRAIA